MAADENGGWLPGQDPPWLAAYGAAPQQVLGGIPPTGPLPQPNPFLPAPAYLPPPPSPPPSGHAPEPIGVDWEAPPSTPAPKKKDDKKRIGMDQIPEEVASDRDRLMPLPADAPAPVMPSMFAGAPGVVAPAGAPLAPRPDGPLTSPYDLEGPAMTPGDVRPTQGEIGNVYNAFAPTALDRAAALPPYTPTVADAAQMLNRTGPVTAPGQVDQKLTAEAIARMAPEDVAALTIQHEQARLHLETAQKLELARKTDETARRNFEAYQQAVQHANEMSAQVSADAQRLAQTKIDPDRFGKNLGTGGSVMALLATTLGGAMSQYTGGKNLALDQFDRRIQADIDAQKTDIANGWKGLDWRKGDIAAEFQRHGDLYRAQETYRMAQYDRAISTLQTQMQDYDPQGTTALRIAATTQQFQAARAQQERAIAQQAFTNKLNYEKDVVIKRDELADKARHEREEEAVARSNSAHSWAMYGLEKKKMEQENQVFTIGQLKQLHPGMDLPPFADNTPITQKQLDHWQTTQTKGLELQKKQSDAKADENKGRVVLPTQTGTTSDGRALVKPAPLTTKSGDVWRASERFEKMAPGVQRANELANRLAREIEEWGGQSDIKKSAHWQQLHSDYQDLIFELHQAKGVEGFRPGTAEMLHDLTGDVDPTSYFRNATPGILRAAQNMTEDLNAEAAIKGYDGPPIKFADTSKLPPAERRPIDSINEQLSTKVDPLSKKSDPRDRAWQVAESGDPTKAAAFEPTLLEDPFVKRSVSVGVPPSQLQIFDQLKTRALGDDVALRNEAINAISEQATNGRTKAIRDYSSRLLKDVATESFEADQRRQDLKSEASRVR